NNVSDLSRLYWPQGSGRHRHAGGSVPLLLSERALPRPWPARGRQPDRLRPLWQGPATPDALLPHLQGAVLRAQGDAPVRLPTDGGERSAAPRARGRGDRRPPHPPTREGEPQHGRPLQPPRGRPRPPAP